jgi:hypothetical protein
MNWMKWAILVVVLIVLLAQIPAGITYHRARYTCVICRANRLDYVYRRKPWTSEYMETACTLWYRENVEAAHTHVWSRSEASTSFNLYGQATGAFDNSDRPGRAIWRLTPDNQLALYKQAGDPLELRDLFVSLMDRKTMSKCHDLLIVESLRTWMAVGFEGPLPRVSQLERSRSAESPPPGQQP